MGLCRTIHALLTSRAMQQKWKAASGTKETPACKALESTEDEFDSFGKMVAEKLREMDVAQRTIAKELFSEVLLHANKKTLETHSVILLRPTSFKPNYTQAVLNQTSGHEPSSQLLKSLKVADCVQRGLSNVKEEPISGVTVLQEDHTEGPGNFRQWWIKIEPGQEINVNSGNPDQDTGWDVAHVKVEPEVEMTVEEHDVELGRVVLHPMARSVDKENAVTREVKPSTSSLNHVMQRILDDPLVSSHQSQKPARKHTRTIGDKCYRCPTCEKTFTTSSNLTSHLRLHSGERPYECQTCGKCFNKGSDLTRHTRVHSGERPYKCETCGKGFVKRSDLNGHTRVHTGERPYKCHTCSKRFVNGSDFTCHLRIHTGERPYICDKCGKSFVKSTDLTRHVRTHAAGKSFQCNSCNKWFNKSLELTRHRQIGPCIV